MTRYARRASQVVVVIDMAVRAQPRRHGVRSSQRESSAVVVERGICPGRCAVAGIAGLREIRRYVVGVGGPLIVLQVAGHAARVAQAVVAVDVAIAALPWRHRMSSR